MENEVNPIGDVGETNKGSPFDDLKVTGLQSELCDPNSVYAVVDESKKTKNRIKAK